MFGPVSFVSGLAFVVMARGETLPSVIGAWFLVFGAFVTAVPFWYAMRVRRALLDGLVVDATVVQLDSAEGPNRRTMDAMGNGYAAGRRWVQHPLGGFDESFEFDGPGASGLRTGSRMSLLVDPAQRRTLLTVGVADLAAV